MRKVEIEVDVTHTARIIVDVPEETYLELCHIYTKEKGDIGTVTSKHGNLTEFLSNEIDESDAWETRYEMKYFQDISE